MLILGGVTQRGDRTEALLVEAWRLLATTANGKPLTIKRLCEKAGVNRGTFYLHYESLDEIRLQEEERIVRTILSIAERFDGHIVSSADPAAELTDIFAPVLNFVTANRNDIPLFLALLEETRFRNCILDGIRLNLRRWYGPLKWNGERRPVARSAGAEGQPGADNRSG